MEYGSASPVVRLIGPNGSFSYEHEWSPGIPFAEFPVLPLTNIRELRLAARDQSIVFHPSSFPALETLAVEYSTDLSRLFSAFFSKSLISSLVENPRIFGLRCLQKVYGGIDTIRFQP